MKSDALASLPRAAAVMVDAEIGPRSDERGCRRTSTFHNYIFPNKCQDTFTKSPEIYDIPRNRDIDEM